MNNTFYDTLNDKQLWKTCFPACPCALKCHVIKLTCCQFYI